MSTHNRTQTQCLEDIESTVFFKLPREIRDLIWEELVHTGGHVSEIVTESGNLELVNPLFEVNQQLAEELDGRIARCDDMVLIISTKSFIDSISRVVPLRTRDLEQFIPRIALEMTIWPRKDKQSVMPFEMAMTTGRHIARFVSFLNGQRAYFHLRTAEVFGFDHEILFEMDLNFSREQPRTDIIRCLGVMKPWFIPPLGNMGAEWLVENVVCPRVNFQGLDPEISEELRLCWTPRIFLTRNGCLTIAEGFVTHGRCRAQTGDCVGSRAMYLLANYWLTQDVFPSNRAFDVAAFYIYDSHETLLLHQVWIALSELSLKLGRISEAYNALIYQRQELYRSHFHWLHAYSLRIQVEILLMDASRQMGESVGGLPLQEADEEYI